MRALPATDSDPSVIQSTWAAVWKILPNVPIYDWAAASMKLGSPYTKTGKVSLTETRHLMALFDAYQNIKIREINVCAPVRGAKTLFADICHPWTVIHRPGPTLFLFQDEKAAKDQAELRTWPNIRRCEEVAALLSADRFKNRGTEIIFPHMVFHIRGPATSNLQSRGYQYVWLDEPWQYAEGKMEEARGRLGDFAKNGTDKLICLSQGGYYQTDWDRQFNSGIIHDWSIKCIACGHQQIPTWSGTRPDGSAYGMRWNEAKTPDGLWDIPACLPTIRYECEKCGHSHTWSTATRQEWNRTGQYIAESNAKKLPSKVSFRWTAIIDTPWPLLVDLYLKAVNAWKLGSAEALVQFFQKRMAQMASEESLLQNKLNFRKASYELQSKPNDAIRILGVDRQTEETYWVVARDWWVNGKSRRVHFAKLFGEAEIEELRKKLGIDANKVLIDSGYQPKGDRGVYAACLRYGWIPVKGVATEGGDEVLFTHRRDDGGSVQRTYLAVDVDAECGRGPEDIATLVKFSAPTYAQRVHNLNDRGLWLEPDGLDADPLEKEYKAQMAAEYRKPIIVGNRAARRTKFVWHCPSGNNHAFDCSKIQVLAATLLDILPDLQATDEKATP